MYAFEVLSFSLTLQRTLKSTTFMWSTHFIYYLNEYFFEQERMLSERVLEKIQFKMKGKGRKKRNKCIMKRKWKIAREWT